MSVDIYTEESERYETISVLCIQNNLFHLTDNAISTINHLRISRAIK